MNSSFLTTPSPNLALNISKWPPFSKWLTKWLPKSRKFYKFLTFNLFGHAVREFTYFLTSKIQNGRHFRHGRQNLHQNPYFTHLSL